MKLLRRCYKRELFKETDDLELDKRHADRLERNACLGGCTYCTVVVFRQRRITTRAVVPVFLDL